MCISGEGPSVYWEKRPKARKTHTCCECFSAIEFGERYELYEGVWDGKFARFRTCRICSDVRKIAIKNLLEKLTVPTNEGIVFGCLWETVGIEHEDV